MAPKGITHNISWLCEASRSPLDTIAALEVQSSVANELWGRVFHVLYYSHYVCYKLHISNKHFSCFFKIPSASIVKKHWVQFILTPHLESRFRRRNAMTFKRVLIFSIGISLLGVSDQLYSPRKKSITLKSEENAPV